MPLRLLRGYELHHPTTERFELENPFQTRLNVDAVLDAEDASGEAPSRGLWWEKDSALSERFKRQ